MTDERWSGKDLEGSDRGLIQVPFWHLVTRLQNGTASVV
jgi:hypothetical protein